MVDHKVNAAEAIALPQSRKMTLILRILGLNPHSVNTVKEKLICLCGQEFIAKEIGGVKDKRMDNVIAQLSEQNVSKSNVSILFIWERA